MHSLNDITLESNMQIKINFDVSDLSSDAGPLLLKKSSIRLGLSSASIGCLISGDPVLLRTWQDGKFHQGRKTWF